MNPATDEILDYKKISWTLYNARKKAGVVKFSYGDGFIWIEFNDGRIYLYTEKVSGIDAINRMKQLAEQGEKLSTFINQNDKVRDNYVTRYAWRDGAFRKF